MNMTELAALMDRHGKDATLAEVATAPGTGADEATTMFGAMAQRMIPVPKGYDYEGRAVECQCGLLLEELPRATTLERAVVVLGKARRASYRMTHAHIAPGVCSECYDGSPCVGHPTAMCDTPEPELCGHCCDQPAAMGKEVCRDCARGQELAEYGEWDADAYYGTE